MRLTRHLSAVALVCAVAAPASAQHFAVQYLGNNTSQLAPGSDDPVGWMLNPGDTFTWSIGAQAGWTWHVVGNPSGFFPLMAFGTQESAQRYGDWTLDLSRNGATVYTETFANALNNYVHIGSNTVFLNPGLDFDLMHLTYTLNQADEVIWDVNNQPVLTGNPAATTLSGQLPIFGAPDQNSFYPGITYVGATTTTPEPATVALVLGGLGMLAVVTGRRSRMTT